MTIARAIALLASAIATAPALAQPAPPPARSVVLDIPYVPQTEALCGGAAVAMVLRYWGARQVVAEDFAPLLDSSRTGIRTGDLAGAVRQRGWNAVALDGTADIVRDQIARRRPVIALIDAGRGRFHYVVIAAWTDRGVIAHDPARAPDREYSVKAFERAWASTRNWMLVITPRAPDGATASPTEPQKESDNSPGDVPTVGGAFGSLADCDKLVASAIAEQGSESTERLLARAVGECPGSAAARRELAGYRLTHGATAEAAALAEAAVRIDPGDAHAWYLLGAARYLAHNPAGALDAWNHIGEPRLDLIQVEGLGRASYRSIAGSVGLDHGDLITPDDMALARRRVADLPAVAMSRVEVEPRGQGLAQIDIGVVERDTVPRSSVEWIAAGARAAVDRELAATFANINGSGDTWTGSWRWWNNRPRVGFGVAAPGLFHTNAVWQVDAFWEAQSYAAGTGVVRSERTHASLAASDWLTPSWKWHATSGIDRWTGRGAHWFGGGSMERQSTDDRTVVGGDLTFWSGSERFARLTADASWTSRAVPRGWRVLTDAGAALATADAPFDLWEGAGVGHARAPLLRAHPLLDDGVVTGPAFGRTIEHATAAIERWPATMKLWSVGVASFIDLAAAQHRADSPGGLWFADVGAGARIRAAWLPGILRIDYAHGVRDGANAVSVGWMGRIGNR